MREMTFNVSSIYLHADSYLFNSQHVMLSETSVRHGLQHSLLFILFHFLEFHITFSVVVWSFVDCQMKLNELKDEFEDKMHCWSTNNEKWQLWRHDFYVTQSEIHCFFFFFLYCYCAKKFALIRRSNTFGDCSFNSWKTLTEKRC